jgi:hypothetical protein
MKNAGRLGETDAVPASDQILKLLTCEVAPKAYANYVLLTIGKNLLDHDCLTMAGVSVTTWIKSIAGG